MLKTTHLHLYLQKRHEAWMGAAPGPSKRKCKCERTCACESNAGPSGQNIFAVFYLFFLSSRPNVAIFPLVFPSFFASKNRKIKKTKNKKRYMYI